MVESRGIVFDLDVKGRGILRDEEGVIFLKGGFPGDEVLYRETRRKKRLREGEVLEVLAPSPNRQEPPCPYANRCGGCDIMDLSYGAQLAWKKKRIEDVFARLAKHPITTKVQGMDRPAHYRNHMQWKVEGRHLGLYGRGSREVVPIEHCLIAEKPMNNALSRLQGYRGLSGVSQLLMRTNREGEMGVLLAMEKGAHPKTALHDALLDLKPRRILLGREAKGKGHVVGPFEEILSGELVDTFLGEEFLLPERAFFQVNRTQAEALVGAAIEGLSPRPDDVVLDLYCGIGTITLPLARRVKEVQGVEVVEEAVERGRDNARRNKIQNAFFAHGKSEALVERLLRETKAKKIVVDPPRSGCDVAVLSAITDSEATRLVYVSCDPATLTRDSRLLLDGGWTLESVQGFDLFCHSLHVESLGIFSR